MLTGSKGLFCISTLFRSFVLSVYCYKIRKCKLRMCIVHAGFRGFRAFVARKKSRCKLIRNRFVIPHDTIHEPLASIKPRHKYA